VHRVHEAQPIANAALADEVFDLGGDVDVVPAIRGVEPELFAEVFHAALPVRAKLASGLRYDKRR